MKNKATLAVLFSFCLASMSVLADAPMNNTELMETVQLLKKRIEMLEKQVAAQARQMDTQSQKIEERAAQVPAAEEAGWFKDVEISGLLEVEAGHTNPYTGGGESDIVLATVELGVDAKIYDDWVTAHILALHEDDDTAATVPAVLAGAATGNSADTVTVQLAVEF